MSRTFTSRPGYTQTRGGRGRAATPSRSTHSPSRGAQGTRGTQRGRGSTLTGQTSVRGLSTSPRARGTSINRGSRGRGMDGPSGYQGYGRGRGRGIGAYGGEGVDEVVAPGPSKDNQHPTQQDRMERRDAYTVIRPDESKRNAIAEQARRGEESYQRHKESHRTSHVSYHGTVGGGGVTQDAARNRSQQQHKQAPLNKWQKSQQYKADQRGRENKELDQKKTEARRRSEANCQREEDRDGHLREDERRKRAAFLDRIEQENKAKKGQKILSSSAAKSFSRDSESPPRSQDKYPSHSLGRATYYSPGGDTGYSPGGDTGYSPDGDTSRRYQEEGSNEDYETESPLQQLMNSFPGYDQDVLENILLQCNGHVDKARELLS